MRDHFFIGCNGDLFDTREPKWSANVLREHYQFTFDRITSVAQLKSTLRNGRFTSLGSYPLFLITSDSAALCFQCARDEFRNCADSIKTGCNDGWKVVACDINWEDPDLLCDHCGEHIESAYAEEESTS